MSAGELVKLGTGETFALGTGPVSIGRHADNQIILDDARVSRHHAELAPQQNKWVVRDLGSANGTYVNEQRIEATHVLKSGDTIRLGQTSFQVILPIGIAEQNTLVERIPASQTQAPQKADRPALSWLTVALLVALAAVILVGALVIWPRIQGKDQAQNIEATLVVVSTDTSQPATATDTAVPTAPPPTQTPSPEPTETPIPPTATPYPRPVIGVFSAEQTTLEQGQCTRLEWGQVEHATSLELTGVGKVNATGKLDVCPTTSKAYMLKATGPGGTAGQTVPITVQPPAGPIVEHFRVIPSIIAPGDCAQLEWGRVEQATSASIEPDLGGVATPGELEVCPNRTTIYTLTAESVTGVTSVATTLFVSSEGDNEPVISFFTAEPAAIQAGECTLLSWGKVDYATSVTIDNGIGGVATPGSKEVCLGVTTTFVMTARGPSGTIDYDLAVDVSPGRLAELPNLVVESILFEPNPCYLGSPCKVRVKVRNDGSKDAGNFIVRWAPEGEGVVPVEWDVDSLGTLQETTLNYNWIPNRTHERWRTVASVDAYDQVVETSEESANFLDQFITVLGR